VSTSKTLRTLQEAGQDFEWYPTTSEMIQTVIADINKVDRDYGFRSSMKTFMDIGAGDGRVLQAIRDREKEVAYGSACYAIEKSPIHLAAMPDFIRAIGTEFMEQTLADKPVDVIFCNPPYSQYEQWVCKIIQEASAAFVYLIIPQRWRTVVSISQALESRAAEVQSLGEFDFESGDRQARAHVEIVRLETRRSDVFDDVIEGMLPELDVFEQELPAEEIVTDLITSKNRGTLIESLVDSYNHDMGQMLKNYRAALAIDREILSELSVTKEQLITCVGNKIKHLKQVYWNRLFSELYTVRNRLATRQRKAFLASLHEGFAIDFTLNNVYMILMQVATNANKHFDQQLIDLFKSLSRHCDAVNYKSNAKTWGRQIWRYASEDPRTHFRLDYRIIMEFGGIARHPFDFELREYRGLTQTAFETISDCLTVANNLGFTCNESPKTESLWKPGKKVLFYDPTGKRELLSTKAHLKGNLHLQFDSALMLAINIEAGRLLGWLHSAEEAVHELQLTGEDAEAATRIFGSSHTLRNSSPQLLLGAAT